nr:DinB family protein [Limobrevibacterium gyesilva]
MAAYNAEANRRWYAAAGGLTDAQRRAPCGAFWDSIHGTLNHLLWADGQWMSRFAGWPKPVQGIRQSDALFADFAELAAARVRIDADISAWAAGLDQAWLDQDLVYFSGAAQREMRRPRALLVMHMFNHQTHHRGQAHALLTRFDADTGDTDLPLVL